MANLFPRLTTRGECNLRVKGDVAGCLSQRADVQGNLPAKIERVSCLIAGAEIRRVDPWLVLVGLVASGKKGTNIVICQ